MAHSPPCHLPVRWFGLPIAALILAFLSSPGTGHETGPAIFAVVVPENDVLSVISAKRPPSVGAAARTAEAWLP
jgi:hypothetical protein